MKKVCDNISLHYYTLLLNGHVKDIDVFIEKISAYLKLVQCSFQVAESLCLLMDFCNHEKLYIDNTPIKDFLNLKHALMFGSFDLFSECRKATLQDTSIITKKLIECHCSIGFTVNCFIQLNKKVKYVVLEYLCLHFIEGDTENKWLLECITTILQKGGVLNLFQLLTLLPCHPHVDRIWTLLVLCAEYHEQHKDQTDDEIVLMVLGYLKPFQNIQLMEIKNSVALKLAFTIQQKLFSYSMFRSKERPIISANIAIALMKSTKLCKIPQCTIDYIESQINLLLNDQKQERNVG